MTNGKQYYRNSIPRSLLIRSNRRILPERYRIMIQEIVYFIIGVGLVVAIGLVVDWFFSR